MVLDSLAEAYPLLLLGEFCGSEKDSLTVEQTPAGPVEVLYLYHREDFEQVLRLLAYRGRPEVIPATTGAMTVRGLYNHRKKEKDVLIILSEGPYSGVSARRAGQPEDTWLEISGKIRLYHECTHVICGKLFPQQKDAVWDEIVADAVGLRKALGYYDEKLAAMFLGVSREGYTKGRLENYLTEEKAERLPRVAAQTYRLIERIGAESRARPELDAYDFLWYLQEKQGEWGQGLIS